MAIYKFRVTFEDYEDVSRDIEIRSSQTFFDFFQIILQSIAFDTKHAGAFFVSDDYWSKGSEITLLEEDVEPGVKLMKTTKIASFIEQPNQRFVFLYDKEICWSLFIELIKLVPEDVKAAYPRCVKILGTAPKQYKQKAIAKLKEEVENGIADEKIADDDIYKAIGDEKLVFDEDEESSLNEDENNLVGAEEEEGDEHGEEHEGEDDHHEGEEHEGGNDNW
ncbi:MAG TPA: hypothetical protein VKG26_09655 [Bacteroidia bacterium]|nr:hypothetical protein [Bacteroidia bacterium]